MDITKEIDEMMYKKNMGEEGVLNMIRDALISAYKKKFGTDENVVVKFSENEEGIDNRCVDLFSVKEVVEEENWRDPVKEIPLDDAKDLLESVEVGDIIEISIDPKTFGYSAVQSARQKVQQVVKDYNTDRVYTEAKHLEGKLVLGIIKPRVTRNGDPLVDIGLDESADVIFPQRSQNPRETYSVGERLKFFVESVEKNDESNTFVPDGKRRKRREGVRVVVSRSSRDFVKSLLTFEVPEIQSGDVEIKAIARSAGYRTKIAVSSTKAGVDPIVTTVGKLGARILAVTNECAGEKMDVIKYSDDILEFISNALTPAVIKRVVTIDPSSKHVVAIVDEGQLGLAIGQSGVNVRLANQLCDWNIEVKTEDQYNEMEETVAIYKKVDTLFTGENLSNVEIGIGEDETPLTELSLDDDLIERLHKIDIWSVEEFFSSSEKDLLSSGITQEELEYIKSLVEFSDDEFECPVCHTMLPSGTTVCPNCNSEFEFE